MARKLLDVDAARESAMAELKTSFGETPLGRLSVSSRVLKHLEHQAEAIVLAKEAEIEELRLRILDWQRAMRAVEVASDLRQPIARETEQLGKACAALWEVK